MKKLKLMKKIILLFVILTLSLFILTGCTTTTNSKETPGSGTPSEPSQPTEEASAPPQPPAFPEE